MSSAIDFANYSISSNIGMRWGKMHKGIDFAIPTGTNIQSVTGGTVIYTGYQADGAGNYVKVKDSTGNVHYYMHLSKILTAAGETVQPGQQIGLSGNTGKSTGPHLHYQVLDSAGTVLNGLDFLNNYNGAASPAPGETISPTLSSGNIQSAALGLAGKILLIVSILVLAFFSLFFLDKSLGGVIPWTI